MPRARIAACLALGVAATAAADPAPPDDDAPVEGEVVEVEGTAPEQTTPTEYRLGADDVRRTPGAMNDALRAVTILPAAARIPYSFGGLVLRGMSPRDTGVFIDGVEIPIAFHFGGISAVFPTALMEDVRVVPSGFDVSIGRTQGGVVELVSRQPRRDRLRVAGEVSLLHAAASAEGPTWRRGAFLIGVRRSYVDVLARPFLARDDPAPSYVDGQGRVVWGTPRSGELSSYVLGSLDQLANASSAAAPNDPEAGEHYAASLGFARAGAGYRRRTGAVTWQLAPYVGTNVLKFHSVDYHGGPMADEARYRRRWYQYGGRAEALRDDAGGFIRAGIDVAGGYLGRVGNDIVAEDVDDELDLPRNTVLWTDAAVWAETRRHWLDDRLSVRPGIRVDRFGLGRQTTLDVRVNAHAALSPAAVARASLGRFHQPPSPAHFDQFTDNLEAHSSYVDQATLGIEWTPEPRIGAGIAGFWHEGHATLVDASADPDDTDLDVQSQIFRELLEEQLGFYSDQRNRGAQRSYGAEISARYQSDRFRLLANYTWSRALRRYLVPDRAWVPYGLDQPLRLNVVAGMALGKWNLGVRFTATSGNPARLYPEGTIYDPAQADPAMAPLVRLPAYWQLDVRADRSWHTRWGTMMLFFDVLNATYHRNVEARQNTLDGDPLSSMPSRYGYDDTLGLPIVPIVGVEVVPDG